MNAYRILVKGIVKKDDRYLIVEKWYDDNIMDPHDPGADRAYRRD